MRVLLVGHMDPGAAQPLGFRGPSRTHLGVPDGVIAELAQGFRGASGNADLKVLPWGPGPAFVRALRGLPGDPWVLSADRRERPGVEMAWVEREGAGTVFLEMGHDRGHDWGRRVLAKLAGKTPPENQPLPELWADAAAALTGRTVVVAASTSRPLLGAGSTAALDPSLGVRAQADPVPGWRQTLQEAWAERTSRSLLPEEPQLRVDELPGGGAGGGAGAALAALGAKVFPTGDVLAAELNLAGQLARADLLVVAAPYWNGPDLADEPALVAAQIAAQNGVPTVGVGIWASLSHQEKAELGLHGLHIKRPGRSWADLGRRVGQTWARNYAG